MFETFSSNCQVDSRQSRCKKTLSKLGNGEGALHNKQDYLKTLPLLRFLQAAELVEVVLQFPPKQLDPIKVLEIGKVFGSLTGGVQLLLAKRSFVSTLCKRVQIDRSH